MNNKRRLPTFPGGRFGTRKCASLTRNPDGSSHWSGYGAPLQGFGICASVTWAVGPGWYGARRWRSGKCAERCAEFWAFGVQGPTARSHTSLGQRPRLPDRVTSEGLRNGLSFCGAFGITTAQDEQLSRHRADRPAVITDGVTTEMEVVVVKLLYKLRLTHWISFSCTTSKSTQPYQRGRASITGLMLKLRRIT